MSRIHPPSDTPLTEADMQAFADGNLPPERAARVRNYLGARPREAERIAFYRRLNMQMRNAFEGAFPQRIRDAHGERERTAAFPSAPPAPSAIGRFSARRFSTALIGIALVVLSASGWFFASRVTTEMLNAAAVMALMSTSSQRANDAPTAAPTDPHAVDLAPLGLKLAGEMTRHPNALASIDVLDYRNADGEAVVLLSSSAPFAADKPHWIAQRVGNARLLMWTVNGTRYVLAGRADTHGLMRAADALTVR
jgi:anti-sigma factor RsiW